MLVIFHLNVSSNPVSGTITLPLESACFHVFNFDYKELITFLESYSGHQNDFLLPVICSNFKWTPHYQTTFQVIYLTSDLSYPSPNLRSSSIFFQEVMFKLPFQNPIVHRRTFKISLSIPGKSDPFKYIFRGWFAP